MAGGPAARPPGSSRSVGDDDGVEHLVGESLATVVPDRPEEADVAGKAVQEVGDLADEAHAGADRLTVVHAQELQAERLLAPRLPGAALHDPAVVDPYAEGDQVQQDCDQGRAARAAVARRRQDRDRDDELVDQVGTDPLKPVGELVTHVVAGLLAAIGRLRIGTRGWLAVCPLIRRAVGALPWWTVRSLARRLAVGRRRRWRVGGWLPLRGLVGILRTVALRHRCSFSSGRGAARRRGARPCQDGWRTCCSARSPMTGSLKWRPWKPRTSSTTQVTSPASQAR